MRHVFPIAALVILTGCAVPASYRYSNRILTPPGVKNAAVVVRSVTIPITATCSSSEDGLRMAKRGHSVRVTVQTKPLMAHPAGWLTAWATSLEQKGCIGSGDGAILAARVAELLPADPRNTATLLHPSAAISGYADLAPGMRIKVVGPIVRGGGSALAPAQASGSDGKINLEVRSSKDFLGYETAWFDVQPLAAKPGSQIVFLSADDHIAGEQVHPEKPRLDYFHFVPDAAFFRLFYLTRITQADHDIAVLAAPSKASLEEQTKRFAADPSSCGTAHDSCLMIPRESAIVPHILVTAAGAEIPVPAGGSIGDALKAAGVAQPKSVLATLQVKRKFGGNLAPVVFDRGTPEILDLPLTGGEVLAW